MTKVISLCDEVLSNIMHDAPDSSIVHLFASPPTH